MDKLKTYNIITHYISRLWKIKKMDWTQTLTIILTIGASTAAVWYVVKEDIKRYDVEIRKMR